MAAVSAALEAEEEELEEEEEEEEEVRLAPASRRPHVLSESDNENIHTLCSHQ